MNLRISTLVATAFLSVAAACSPSIQQVDYVPQPQRAAKPRESLPVLVGLNTPPACSSRQGFVAGAFIVKFVCTHGAGGVVLRFDRMESLKIEHKDNLFYVRVHHRGGLDDFYWASRSLEDAQGMTDAIMALAYPPAAPPGTPPAATAPPAAPAADSHSL